MPLQMPPLGHDQLLELEVLYRKARDGRVRVRALCVLLAADQRQSIPEISRIVRYHEETVRRWLNRYLTGGVNGLHDAPKSGAPPKATSRYLEELFDALNRNPTDLGLPFAKWTSRRLADHLAERTGLRLSAASLHRLRHQKTPREHD
ncbi:helix-turn-helix domain-containing protein [Deinococcus sp. SM5_A1]|uniref:helix-turn-helix domain-containing protein n=1 Tax=Deinococcus sp. SM5_A1 TaxID=3379094 RepID=UPI00385B0BF4